MSSHTQRDGGARPRMPAAIPDILTGVSAGGINAACLAGSDGTCAEKIELGEADASAGVDEIRTFLRTD